MIIFAPSIHEILTALADALSKVSGQSVVYEQDIEFGECRITYKNGSLWARFHHKELSLDILLNNEDIDFVFRISRIYSGDELTKVLIICKYR